MTSPADRHETLDLIRGIAVMGILVANLPAFALPEAAYFSPAPWGGQGAWDRAAWLATFVLVEGKMRGLFTLLFGASALLVMERARAAGDDPARAHAARMAWLLLFGLVHLYGLWWGDILAHYALVGLALIPFAGARAGWLVAAGTALVGAQAALGVGQWLALVRGGPGTAELAAAFGAAGPDALARELAAMRGSFGDAVRWRAATDADPLSGALLGGAETLGYVLWGMAALRSGFLTGAWPRRRYRRLAAATLAPGWAAFLALGLLTEGRGFAPAAVAFGSVAASPLARPLLVIGYASLAVLAARPGGRLTARVSAAGRTAFTNYFGTTLVMAALFQGWGLGLFGRLSRAELLWLAPPAWAAMLAWPAPWLRRYRYGPLEWLWRSLARLEWQPMRR